jgi:mRNA interferase MazF
MALKFPPKPRALILCDYGLGGFRAPEMVKRRPVIVIAGNLPKRRGLATVIPLSTTPPAEPLPYVIELIIEGGLPDPFNSQTCWAKCDMIATVGFERLDLFRSKRLPNGQRQYLSTLKVSAIDFDRVRYGILAAIGLEGIAKPLE